MMAIRMQLGWLVKIKSIHEEHMRDSVSLPSLVMQLFFHQEEIITLKSPVTKRKIGF